MTLSFIPFVISAAGLALALAVTLFLILNMKQKMRQEAKRIDAMLERLRDAAAPVSAPVILRSGLNLNRRAEAVRLLRGGEDIARVAAAVGIPQGEVELLERVERIVAHRAAKAAGE